MNNLFPPELRTASVVQRWSIVRTHHRENIAEHQYYVTYYALQIARLIQWDGPLDDLMFVAMFHDIEETFTGDILGPVKREIVDEDRSAAFVSEQMKRRLPLIEEQLETIMIGDRGTQIERIVKVADKVDACIYLILEQVMGNQRLSGLYVDATQNLHRAVIDLAKEFDYNENGDHELWAARLINDEISPALAAHWHYGGIGLTT